MKCIIIIIMISTNQCAFNIAHSLFSELHDNDGLVGDGYILPCSLLHVPLFPVPFVKHS